MNYENTFNDINSTVVPLLRDTLWFQQTVVSQKGWPFIRGSLYGK